jgi:hypothetical protein
LLKYPTASLPKRPCNFGELVPYGQVWRTGANMSTDITFKTDVLFGGKEVKKGTYSIFTIPEEKEWTIILNSQPKQKVLQNMMPIRIKMCWK